MKGIKTLSVFSVFLLCWSLPLAAAVQTKTVAYSDGDVALQGYLAWDDALSGKRPGVIVVHEWWGLNDYARSRARMLARLGYVAFAVDMYGHDKVTDNPKQAGEWAHQVTSNIAHWQHRALLGLNVLRRQPQVDSARIAAIGYCFGGATVMQMAYAGADLKGVVSFHGSLPIATPAQAAKIKAKILIAHGDADAFESREHVARFQEALEGAHVDWYMVSYGGAHHAFTNPDAGRYGVPNIQYNAEADRRSWREMRYFLAEIFAQ